MADLLQELEAVKSMLDRKIEDLTAQNDDPKTQGKILGLSMALGAIEPVINARKESRHV